MVHQSKEEEVILNIAKELKQLEDIEAHSSSHDIDNIRELIDVLDDEICRKLHVRQRAVDVIHYLKEEEDMDIKDAAREDEIKQKLICEYPEIQETIEKLYNHLFDQTTI